MAFTIFYTISKIAAVGIEGIVRPLAQSALNQGGQNPPPYAVPERVHRLRSGDGPVAFYHVRIYHGVIGQNLLFRSRSHWVYPVRKPTAVSGVRGDTTSS